MVLGYMFRQHCGHLQANLYRYTFFNSVFLSHICHDCTHNGIPYYAHIEGTLSVQVGLKMAAMRPKHVAKNHYVVALSIVSFIIVVYDVKYIRL